VGAFGHENRAHKILILRGSAGMPAAHSARMTKLLKTILIAGSLITSTAIVSFADAPKTADKAGAGSASGSAAGSASKGTTSTKGSTPAAKGSGAGSATKSGK
jgi:hypothetical protein